MNVFILAAARLLKSTQVIEITIVPRLAVADLVKQIVDEIGTRGLLQELQS